MSVAWFRSRKGPSDSPTKGTSDGPSAAYSHPRVPGRGDHRTVLPHRRHLCPPQPKRASLRVHKEALRLRGAHPGALAAASGRGERTLVLAGCPAVLLPPVPGGSGAAPFLLQPAQGLQEAQALPGAPASRGPLRAGGRSGDLARRLHLARSPASAPSPSVGGLRWGRVGTLGKLQRLRGQAAPPVRPQPHSHLL